MTPHLHLKKNERGFTLVEAMIAMFVCTIGLFAMAGLLAVTLRMQQLGRNSTSASRVAQDKVDELNTVGFGAASMACGGSLTADVANHNDDALWSDGTRKGYRRRWLVGPGPDAATSLRAVTVRVTPDVNDRRVTQVFDLQTIIRGTAAAVCP